MDVAGIILLIYPMISDLRYKKFYIEPVIIISLLYALAGLVMQPSNWIAMLLGCLPGLLVVFISLITKEAVGMGDALTIMGLGLIIGWERICMTCLAACILSGIAGLFLIAVGRANRKTTLPFVPFLTAAFLMLLLYERWG